MIAFPLPDNLEYFQTHDGLHFEVALKFQYVSEAVGHEAWLSGGHVHGRDIYDEVPGELEGFVVLRSEEDGTYWPVDADTAQEVAEEAHQCITDHGSMYYPSNRNPRTCETKP